MANKNFVELVNSTILESGADLASFPANGTGFSSTTDSLMRRFKEWVARAWKTVQQDADDWHFLTSRAVVNLNPRIMFYTFGEIPGELPATVDIYDSDDNLKIENLPISDMADLTNGYGAEFPRQHFGYIDVAEAAFPVNFTLKPGNDYFLLGGGRVKEAVTGAALQYFFANGVSVGSVCDAVVYERSHPFVNPQFIRGAATITLLDPDTNDISLGTTESRFISNSPELLEYMNSGDFSIELYYPPLPPDITIANYVNNGFVRHDYGQDPPVVSWQQQPSSYHDDTDTTLTPIGVKAFVHSWGSYDWNEELSLDDFSDDVKEPNTATYKVIRNHTPDPGVPEPLINVPWQSFLERVDGPQRQPSDPAFISEDSQGRWRLWPYPKERVTVTFDYTRSPQILKQWNDIPRNLDPEYEDIVMWLALIYYGQFDEQPGIVRRATKNYMDLRYRFEKNKRPDFVFRPANFQRR